MLVALRDRYRYAPSDTTRIRELKVKYEKLKSCMPKRESLDDWRSRLLNALITTSWMYRRMVLYGILLELQRRSIQICSNFDRQASRYGLKFPRPISHCQKLEISNAKGILTRESATVPHHLYTSTHTPNPTKSIKFIYFRLSAPLCSGG
jgi:hypothetical protein